MEDSRNISTSTLRGIWEDIEESTVSFEYEMEWYFQENEECAEEYGIYKLFKIINYSLTSIQLDIERHLIKDITLDLDKIEEFEIIFNSVICCLKNKIGSFKKDNLLDFTIKGVDFLVLSKYVIESLLLRCKMLKRN
ncbi:hypothetical protein GCM10008904_14310 [Paraclostridium ghonii]|uniref:Hydrolase (HD superfamily) n=1 Tax=Paraclostridium ghonii TaxID=29358 RepID=A0ABU0MZW8_9FIRM|nr:hypothetical protein [Paeniclostridium ghonii]MDQ0556452.1 putative hydrolase (HD superfamily) [Paeniclostridium ghonii]